MNSTRWALYAHMVEFHIKGSGSVKSGKDFYSSHQLPMFSSGSNFVLKFDGCSWKNKVGLQYIVDQGQDQQMPLVNYGGKMQVHLKLMDVVKKIRK